MSDWKTRITKIQAVKPAKSEDDDNDAYLVMIYPPGPNIGKRWSLTNDEVVIGRGSDCDIQVDRDSVSRRHARVFSSGKGWAVEDLGSTNGTYINDVPIDESSLRDMDFLKIGSAIFKFLAGSTVETAYHEEIYRMTIIDGLTGAHNKRYFLEFLEREIARCSRYERPLSLLMFDIDHFKKVNDVHGHLTGDYVLREMSRRLLARIRKEELLARYGGEEFAAVLPETDHAGALQFAEQLRTLVADEAFSYEGDTFKVTISIGVHTMSDYKTALTPEEFIGFADDNLYRAKRSGRNCVIG